MKRSWVVVALLGLLLYADASQSEAATKFFPYAFTEATLDNGLTVVVVPMESPGLVAYYSIVRTGSRDEYEPDHSGFAHFFEHMMFRGTKKYPGDVYDKLVTEMGANANAFTSSDVTCYYLQISTEDLEKTMELESDRFQNLWYEEEAFKTEAGAVYGEYRKSISSAGFVLYETLMNTAFDAHTYKHTTIGFEKDIKAMPTMYEYSKSFFQRYYRPENVVLLIVGDVQTEPTLAMVKKYYSAWTKGYKAPPVPVEPEQTAARRANAAFDGKTLPILAVAYKSPAYTPTDVMPAACVLLGDLAFGETSDLYKKLVLDEQRVQYISGGSGLSRDPELFTINTMVKDPSDIAAVEEEIYKAIEHFRTAPVDQQRLADVKSSTKYGYLMGLETPAGVARSLIGQLSITGTMQSVDAYYTTLNGVTADDIMNAAKQVLVPAKRTVVVVEGK